MTGSPYSILRSVVCLLALAGAVERASAAEPAAGADMFSRKVSFKLTYANRDLVWDGDPGSPTAIVYPKLAARPIATDVCVTTNLISNGSPARRYMREARIAGDDSSRTVYAFTKEREKAIGVVDKEGRFVPNEVYTQRRDLLPTWPVDVSVLSYDPKENSLYYEVESPGPRVTELLDFLPLDLHEKNKPVVGRYSIDFAPSAKGDRAPKPAVVSLVIHSGGKSSVLA
ncbi:MAG TPA: hypothetical protein VGJ26_10070, partial [Pirellulales bacterium]